MKEALDEIEYIIGPVDSKWGAKRAAAGHPEPFPLRYVEIGNEDWFDKSGSYDGRFAQFYDAIKEKYPQLKCISSIGNEHSDLLVTSRERMCWMNTITAPRMSSSKNIKPITIIMIATARKSLWGEWAAQ